MSPPVRELPTSYKPVPLYRLPLTRTARPVVVPYDHGTHPSVGRDDSARRCRNYQMRTNSFVCTVCRFADGGDMSPPYKGFHGNDKVGSRSFFNRAKHTTVIHHSLLALSQNRLSTGASGMPLATASHRPPPVHDSLPPRGVSRKRCVLCYAYGKHRKGAFGR